MGLTQLFTQPGNIGMTSPEQKSRDELVDFRLNAQQKETEKNMEYVSELRVDVVKVNAKLDTVVTDLGRLTKLMYTVLAAFLTAIAGAAAKIFLKVGPGG